MQLIKMLFGILILCTNVQISANETSNSDSVMLNKTIENKKQKRNSSFLSKRFHNPKMMVSIGNKKIDLKKALFALLFIDYFCPAGHFSETLANNGQFFLVIYMLIKEPKNTFIDFTLYLSAGAIAISPLFLSACKNGKFNNMKSILKNPYRIENSIETMGDECPAYAQYTNFFMRLFPYLGAAYMTGTFSPIVSEDSSDKFYNDDVECFD